MVRELTDAYWRGEFDISTSDLDRIERHLHKIGEAQPLDALARRLVAGRLEHGSDPGAGVTKAHQPQVRLWDPAGKWVVGDQVIVARSVGKHMFAAAYARIERVQADSVVVYVEAARVNATYETAASGSANAKKWYAKVREVAAQMRAGESVEDRAEALLLEHGGRVFGALESALRHDSRFALVDGRWFLRQEPLALTSTQVARLRAALRDRTQPATTIEIATLLEPPVSADPEVFALAAALAARCDRFANVGTQDRPKWQAAPVPWPEARAIHWAYDPDTFDILVERGAELTQAVAERLQALGLYDAVVDFADA